MTDVNYFDYPPSSDHSPLNPPDQPQCYLRQHRQAPECFGYPITP